MLTDGQNVCFSGYFGRPVSGSSGPVLIQKRTVFPIRARSPHLSLVVRAGAQGSLGVFLWAECATTPSSCKNTAAPALKHRQKSARSRAVSPIYTGVVIGSSRSFQRWV